MAKMNFDDLVKKREPIEFTLGGKDHIVTNFSPAAFNEAKAISDEFAKSADGGETQGVEMVLARQLAIFTGDPEADFLGLPDLPALIAAHAFVIERVNAKMEADELGKKPRR